MTTRTNLYYISNPPTNTNMKNIIHSIIRLRQRLSIKDVTLIYACALADVAIVASIVGLIVYFI